MLVVNQDQYNANTYLSQAKSTTLLNNPAYITSSSQPANQNTVRVMTPSYSLASLSKLGPSPTSPLTMTVTLGHDQNRRLKNAKNNTGAMQSNHLQQNPSGNYLVDKGQKVVSSSKSKGMGQPSMSHRSINQGSKISQSRVSSKQKPNQVFQLTPRTHLPGGQPVQKPKDISSSISCTISTDHNSNSYSNQLLSPIALAAKALESKNPKFMRTIEESASGLGYTMTRKGGAPTAHIDLKSKQGKSTTRKKGMTASSSGTLSTYKSPQYVQRISSKNK